MSSNCWTNLAFIGLYGDPQSFLLRRVVKKCLRIPYYNTTYFTFRPTLKRPRANLTIVDLVEMCLDVAKGCAYLESVHFVHRDIAARNCLVATDATLTPFRSQRSHFLVTTCSYHLI